MNNIFHGRIGGFTKADAHPVYESLHSMFYFLSGSLAINVENSEKHRQMKVRGQAIKSPNSFVPILEMGLIAQLQKTKYIFKV